MKIRLLASLLPLVLGLTLVHAQDMGAPAPAAAAPAAKAPKTALAKEMGKIAKAYRALGKQIADPTKNDSSLELLATIRDTSVTAATETPAFTADQPEADRAKFVADYQAKQKEFLGAVDKVIADLKAGDNATAAVDAKKLGMEERQGHKAFRKPEKEN
jgi:hypothetical protein